jgi:hypothetical protein
MDLITKTVEKFNKYTTSKEDDEDSFAEYSEGSLDEEE